MKDSYNTNYVRLKWIAVNAPKEIHLADFEKVTFQEFSVPEVDYGFIGRYSTYFERNISLFRSKLSERVFWLFWSFISLRSSGIEVDSSILTLAKS